jgi:uncharacterized protein
MATKEIWINLPVKDVKKATTFFIEMGFKPNAKHSNTDISASFLIGSKEVIMMLFNEKTFSGFTQNTIVNTKLGTEVLFSIDAESVEEVDKMAQKAVDAGGTSKHKPSAMQGWMYGCIFQDLDGHRWNVLFMDLSKK